MCVLTFGADQGTISLVQGNAADSALKTFSNGTITVPAGTTVDFGLNCAENNEQRGAEMVVSGGGTFNFCSAGKFSGNRWKLAVEGTTTLGFNCTGAGINLDSVVVELKNHTAKLSLGNDTRIAAILSHSDGRGTVLLNGHKLTLSGGNALHTGNFAQYSVYGDSGDIEISGGNILTNVYADSFKAFEGDITLRNANLKNAGVTFPTTTDVKIESSGVLTLSNNQTVASLTGSGTTGGVDIFAGNKLVVSGGDQGEKSYCARIAGGGDFEKNGGDTLVLSGANTLTGKTKVNAGTLKVLGSPAANAVEPVW
jgi:autotransporter-associated beta strand protein